MNAWKILSLKGGKEGGGGGEGEEEEEEEGEPGHSRVYALTPYALRSLNFPDLCLALVNLNEKEETVERCQMN